MPLAGWFVTMMLLLGQVGCPVPTDFEVRPGEPNYPPVVDSELTTSYNRSEMVPVGSRPTWSLRVSEPNVNDTLRVKVLKDLDLLNTTPLVTLLETSIFPTDVPPAEEDPDPSVRAKQVELAFTPCPEGSEGARPVLTVCVGDRPFQDPTSEQRNPCLATTDGYTATYVVLVQCIAVP